MLEEIEKEFVFLVALVKEVDDKKWSIHTYAGVLIAKVADKNEVYKVVSDYCHHNFSHRERKFSAKIFWNEAEYVC